MSLRSGNLFRATAKIPPPPPLPIVVEQRYPTAYMRLRFPSPTARPSPDLPIAARRLVLPRRLRPSGNYANARSRGDSLTLAASLARLTQLPMSSVNRAGPRFPGPSAPCRGTFDDEGCRAPSPRELDHFVAIAGQVAVALARVRLVPSP